MGIISITNCQGLPSTMFLRIQNRYCMMEGINNATHRQIVINFYQKNLAKGKLYTVEYFPKLNINRHQVYHAIRRFESGI